MKKFYVKSYHFLIFEEISSLNVCVKNHRKRWFFVDFLASAEYNPQVMDERGQFGVPQETVSPFQMEEMLREAVRQTNSTRLTETVLPYCKAINGLPGLIVVRRFKDDDAEESMSLDVGILDSSQGLIQSLGFADVREQRGAWRTSQRTGVMHYHRPVVVNDGLRVNRDALGNEGIYVSDQARRLGIGRSLISGARVVLNEAGISGLLIKEVRTSDGPGGQFYRNLGKHGGRFIEETYVDPEYGQNGFKVNMYFSTAQDMGAPYIF